MRLDHASRASVSSASAPQYPSTGGRPIVLIPSRPASPQWAPTEPSGEDEYAYSAGEWRDWDDTARGEGSATAAGMQADDADGPVQAGEPEGFVLYCGGQEQETSEPIRNSRAPFRPSPLPMSCASPSPARASAPPPRRSNGCGALVHIRAYPERPRGVWVGKQEASEVVVGLEPSYFERAIVGKMMKSACGCIREGIGCAVCGNTLGTRYLPCQAASEGIFSSSPSSSNRPSPTPPLAHPSGPEYWQCSIAPGSPSSSSGTRSRAFYVYTFFSQHVTPSRPYAFPAQPRAPAAARRTSMQPATPSTPSPQPMYGYRFTASPRPFSPFPSQPPVAPASAMSAGAPAFTLPPPPAPTRPASRPPRLGLDIPEPAAADADAEAAPGMALDPDGVLRDADEMEEPGSPDKTGTEALWPGR
ncbi:hypothetical protein CERSUDRAFT_102733 [Gelatoporia subvermispora B]|uniref:Uncharacterized protein n=1 Tax=Ceriporiopsis subvermispora (strain B) TaxID=914234 RepID=M2RN70_CERS8|nr:hypothetical protein CERSUDRAFT_102733 [Gelatoporia subvermispora B]